MEKYNQDIINAKLFGNDIKIRADDNFGLVGRVLNSRTADKLPLKPGHVYTKEDIWKLEVEKMLKNPQTKEDFDALWAKFNEAIDNNYSGEVIWDYQLQVAKARARVYNQLEENTGD